MKQNEIEFPLQQIINSLPSVLVLALWKTTYLQTAERKRTELFGRRIILKELKFIYIVFLVSVIFWKDLCLDG